jgi:hypothetical protein
MADLITPEQRITNVLAALRATLERPPYAGQKAEALSCLAQLEAHWQAFQAGTLAPVTHDGPF